VLDEFLSRQDAAIERARIAGPLPICNVEGLATPQESVFTVSSNWRTVIKLLGLFFGKRLM
jgi:hypothetical protein